MLNWTSPTFYREMMCQFLQEYLDTVKKFYLDSGKSAVANTVEESNRLISWVENKQMKKYHFLKLLCQPGSGGTANTILKAAQPGPWPKKTQKGRILAEQGCRQIHAEDKTKQSFVHLLKRCASEIGNTIQSKHHFADQASLMMLSQEWLCLEME